MMQPGILSLSSPPVGDQHLTSGLPQILTRYEQTADSSAPARVIVDREGMAAPFLQDLKARGYTVVTVLRTDHYDGLDAFTEVGVFVPLERGCAGQMAREVVLVPAAPTTPKLIPIVTTAATCDAVELAQTYTRRWPAQEKSFEIGFCLWVWRRTTDTRIPPR